MMSNQITSGVIISHGLTVLLTTNSPKVRSYYQNIVERSLPRYQFYDGRPERYDWELEIMANSDLNNIEFNIQQRKVSFMFFERELWENDLEFLLIYVLAHLYSTKGMNLTHALGLRSQSGKGLMLVGGFAAGKSTTSLRLLQSGYRYIGNDRLLLSYQQGRVTMVDGSKPIRMRPEVLRMYFPEYSTLADSVGNRRFISVAHELCEIQAVPTTIDLVVRVKVVPVIDNYCTCREFREVEGNFAQVALYPYLSFFYDHRQLISLTAKHIFGQLNDNDNADSILALSQDIFNQNRCLEIFGNIDWVVFKIKALLET